MARTSADVRADLATAEETFAEASRAYLAGTGGDDAFRDADYARFTLERELERVVEREAREAAAAAAIAQAQADREERQREAERLEALRAPYRRLLDDKLAAYQSKHAFAADDLRAIVAGELAKHRIRERTYALTGEHETINILRERVGELPRGDSPPDPNLTLEQFDIAVTHAISSSSIDEVYSSIVDEVYSSGCDPAMLTMAVSLIAELGGPDYRMREPASIDVADEDVIALAKVADEDVIALAKAKRAVIDLESAAETARLVWWNASDHARRGAVERLQTAQNAAEQARLEVTSRSLALRARNIDAGLVAPAPAEVPSEAAEPVPEASMPVTLKERIAQLFT